MSRGITRAAAAAVGLVLSCLSIARADHVHSVTGPLTVVMATDKRTGKSIVKYRVGDTPVSFLKNPPGIASGTLVEVHGEHDAKGGITAAAGSDMRTITTAAAAASPSGVQKTVVLIVNLKDKSATLTADAARKLVFGPATSVDALYREASFGKVSFAGEVFGPYTIALESTLDDDWKWAYAADDAARAAGVDFSRYTRRVYVMPKLAMGYSGLGTIGGTPSRSWVYDDDATTIAHELGHNLGLQHASTPTSEYGDASSPMGNPWGLVHHNAPNKVELGWVPSQNVETLTTSGTRLVANLAVSGTQVQAVKIAKPGTGEHYFVSYRSATGFDANLASKYRSRASVHRASRGEKTILLASLADGESYSDSVNAITITQTAHDASSSTIKVVFGAQAPPPAAAPTPPQATVSFKAARVTATSLNVRATPMGTLLGTAATGHVFVTTGLKDQGFSEVFWAGRKAWVSSSYLTLVAAPCGKVTAGTLSVRAGPSATEALLGTVKAGDVYADGVGGTTGWRAIQWDGRRTAFVSRSYTADVTLNP